MATSGTEQGNRLMEVVAAEGRELEEDFSRIETETGPEERRRLTDQLLARLAGHTAARREVLYPRLSRDVPDGDSLVDLGLPGLAQIERTSEGVRRPDRCGAVVPPAGDQARDRGLGAPRRGGGRVLPAVVDAIGVDAANELGDALARAGAGVRQ